MFFKSRFDEHVAAWYKILSTQGVPATLGMHVSLYVCDDIPRICFFICSGILVYKSQDRPSHCGLKQKILFNFLETQYIERCRARYQDSFILNKSTGIKGDI